MTHYACYETPLGLIRIGYRDKKILSLSRVAAPGAPNFPSPVSDLAAAELAEYFEGKRKIFDLPLEPMGTPFQMAVWDALRQIPYGETRSYGDIAIAIGKPKAARAVGMACNRNPIWVIIPCHRVIGSNRNLTGYAGGLDMKQALLELEQRNK